MKAKRFLIGLIIFFFTQITFATDIEIIGSTNVNAGDIVTYYYDTSLIHDCELNSPYSDAYWEVEGGTIIEEEQSLVVKWIKVMWETPGQGYVRVDVTTDGYDCFQYSDYEGEGYDCYEGTANIIISSIVQLPEAPQTGFVIDEGCGETTITRTSNPPVGINWYWQLSSSGTEKKINSSSYVTSEVGTYYLRAYDENSGLWSTSSRSVLVNNVIKDNIVNSVTNGNWSNPSTWSCECSGVHRVPQSGDVVTISHEIEAGFLSLNNIELMINDGWLMTNYFKTNGNRVTVKNKGILLVRPLLYQDISRILPKDGNGKILGIVLEEKDNYETLCHDFAGTYLIGIHAEEEDFIEGNSGMSRDYFRIKNDEKNIEETKIIQTSCHSYCPSFNIQWGISMNCPFYNPLFSDKVAFSINDLDDAFIEYYSTVENLYCIPNSYVDNIVRGVPVFYTSGRFIGNHPKWFENGEFVNSWFDIFSIPLQVGYLKDLSFFESSAKLIVSKNTSVKSNNVAAFYAKDQVVFESDFIAEEGCWFTAFSPQWMIDQFVNDDPVPIWESQSELKNGIVRGVLDNRELIKEKRLDIFPNPTNNVINYNLNGADQTATYNISIYNSSGASVRNIYKSSCSGNINVSELSKGVYIFKVTGEFETVTQRFVKN